MPNQAIHPTARLVLWLLFLVAVQTLSGVVLLSAFVFLPLVGAKILRRGWHLMRRARWLLISLFVILSWGAAGEPLWDWDYAPTQEGVLDALTHLGRLLLVLLAVAAFLETMSLPDLLAGARILLRPLQCFGLDPDRGIVRLMLVLRYVETLPSPKDWRSLLDVPVKPEVEMIEVSDRPLRWPDYALVIVGCAAVTGLCLV